MLYHSVKYGQMCIRTHLSCPVDTRYLKLDEKFRLMMSAECACFFNNNLPVSDSNTDSVPEHALRNAIISYYSPLFLHRHYLIDFIVLSVGQFTS